MNDRIYVTTTIPYVNAAPHVGFALELVQARDVVDLTPRVEHGHRGTASIGRSDRERRRGMVQDHGRRSATWVWVAAVAGSMPLAAQSSATAETRPDLGRHFDRYGVQGTFVLYDAEADHRVRYDSERARTGFIPASTFKIFNSLVALETGVVDEEVVVPWDGVDRGSRGWNQDQTLRTAFQRSAVWVYQELARRIGEERMAAWLRREGYGNGDISGGIDQFWLTGGLRISADEQVAFLRRLHAGELGFSERSMAVVHDIMILEEGADYTLRGKTGWGLPEGDDGPQIGWLVGWVERGGRPYFFAMNLETRDPEFPMRDARQEIAYGILRELGVLPAAEPPLDDRGVWGV